MPTILGLAGIDATEVQKKLKSDHTEARPLVGRNLTPLINGKDNFRRADEPLYFMTEDNVFKGLNQTNLITGNPYEAVAQPSSIEAVIVELKTGNITIEKSGSSLVTSTIHNFGQTQTSAISLTLTKTAVSKKSLKHNPDLTNMNFTTLHKTHWKRITSPPLGYDSTEYRRHSTGT